MKKPVRNHLVSLGLSLATLLVITAGVVMYTFIAPHRHFKAIFGVKDIPYLASNVTAQERTIIQPVVDQTLQKLEAVVVADQFVSCSNAECDLHRKKYVEACRLANRYSFDFKGSAP